jgi:hypothetical protein
MITQSTRFATVLLFVLAFVSNKTTAQVDPINVVTTAVPFLRISPDARGGGMGDAGIATLPDANSGFWNLGKTPFNKNPTGIGLTYTPWLKDLGLNDVYLASLAGYHKLDDESALSFSARYFSLGSIQFTDFAGNSLSTYRPREFAIDFGYSRKLSEKLSLGVGLRYIHSDLAYGSVNGVDYKAGNTFAGDIHLYHTNVNKDGQGFSWGIALSNLGGKIGYTNNSQNKDFIPANLGIGGAYTAVLDETNKITFALDINKLLVPVPPTSQDAGGPIDSANLADYRSMSVVKSWFKSFNDGSNQFKDLQFSGGIEYSYNDQFMARAGYFYEDPTKGNRKYFSFGLGLKYNVIGINFSYLVPSGNGVTRNPLSNTMRFGLVFDFAGNK